MCTYCLWISKSVKFSRYSLKINSRVLSGCEQQSSWFDFIAVYGISLVFILFFFFQRMSRARWEACGSVIYLIKPSISLTMRTSMRTDTETKWVSRVIIEGATEQLKGCVWLLVQHRRECVFKFEWSNFEVSKKQNERDSKDLPDV